MYENVDAAALRGNAADCDRVAATSDEILTAIRSSRARATWSGPGADEFDGQLQSVLSAVSTSGTQLREASCDLICAADIVEQDQAAARTALS